jgi:ligand-binding sensor domain-containing protein
VSLPLTQLLGACWLAGLLLLPASPVAASTNGSAWLLRSWLKENGLPDNKVTGLVQTPDGFLWVGTLPSGLARFDGVRFTEFSSTNFVSAPNRGIVAMIGDGSGGMSVATDRGALVLMNREKVQTYLAGRGFPDLPPFLVAEDGEKSLWMSYRAGNACRLKDGNVTCYGEAEGLPETNAVCFLASDRNGQIWFAKAGELGIFRSGQFHSLLHLAREPTGLAAARDGGVWFCSGFHLFKFAEGGKPQDLGSLTQQLTGVGTEQDVLLEDHEGAVWVGTTFSGLFRYNGNGFQRVPTTHPGVLCLTEDAQGSLWVGTDGGGLNQIRPRAVELEGTESGLPFEAVQSMTQETNGTIWAVTQNGGLARRAGNRWVPVPKSESWQEDATCILADRAGDLWVGTRYHGLLCWRTNGFVQVPGLGRTKGQTVLGLLVSRAGDVYLAEATPNAIERFRNGHLESLTLPPEDVRSIRAAAEDTAGRIWIGTSKGVLLRLDGDRAVDETSLIGGTPLSIRYLYATPDGALWIGFAGFGVGRLKDGHFRLIGTGQGLHDDYVSQILLDEKGWLWFGSGGGGL